MVSPWSDAPDFNYFHILYLDAQEFSTLKEKQEFYQNMKSGAESGWDYSTKWFFKEDGSASLYLKDIQGHIIYFIEVRCLSRHKRTRIHFTSRNISLKEMLL